MKGTQVQSASYIPESMKWDTKFDKFMQGLHKKGQSYAQWQNEKYATRTSHKGGVVNEL